MTLIMLFILMGMVNAHWIWYPIVFIIWCIRLSVKMTSGLMVLSIVADSKRKMKQSQSGE